MCYTGVQQLLIVSSCRDVCYGVYLQPYVEIQPVKIFVVVWNYGYAGSSLKVKIETDNNDAVEIKTEADSNDITEHPCDDRPSIGMFGLVYIH